MKNNIKIALSAIALSLSIFATACDEVDPPYVISTKTEGLSITAGEINSRTDTINTNRVTLLEEFTGHQCINCPVAAEIAASFLSSYPGKIIVMAHHYGDSYAKTDADFPYDYRNQYSTAIGDKYGAGNLPTGMFNRASFNSGIIQSRDAWTSIFPSKIDASSPKIKLELSASNGADTTTINVTAKLTYLVAQDSANYISFYLMQDSLVTRQKTNTKVGVIEKYVHQHVVREAMNSTWGTQIASTISKGATYTATLNYTIPAARLQDSLWRNKDLKVVAFVHRGYYGEVLQAAEVDLVK